MIVLAITTVAIMGLIATAGMLAEIIHSGWGRIFDRELIRDGWLGSSDSICDVLHAELIQRSDRLSLVNRRI